MTEKRAEKGQLLDSYSFLNQNTIGNVHRNMGKGANKVARHREGNMVFFGDESWNLILNMMIGIQTAVRSVKSYQQVQEPEDFHLKYYFELLPRRHDDEQRHPAIHAFIDYAPNTFNRIRKLFSINNEEYLSSVGPSKLMAALMLGKISSMTELTSQGKSGSFFYYSWDGKYMLKTIHAREFKLLRAILKNYYQHLKAHPRTLITKFYGLHKLIEKDQHHRVQNETHFVIMANVFETRKHIAERYDLKGSTHGREASDNSLSTIKKDNDFLARRTPFYISQE